MVTEYASVTPDDWPYEYAPLLGVAAGSIAPLVKEISSHGTQLILGLNHCGGQGSSSYSQAAMFAPSPFVEASANEVSAELLIPDIEAIVAGFRTGAEMAREFGLAGVEINAGQNSLARQFLSPLTNLRSDSYGANRALFLGQVLDSVREVAPKHLVGLRLCIDELAPWGGLSPTDAAGIYDLVANTVDYLVVEQGSIYTQHLTHPDFHAPQGFLNPAIERFLETITQSCHVIAVNEIVEFDQAETELARPSRVAVDLTKALIADPAFLAHYQAGKQPRPCIACNQGCQVRDRRNPKISCAVNPDAGYETEVLVARPQPTHRGNLVVIGAGIAGMEAALCGQALGWSVRLYEQSSRIGGQLATLSASHLNNNIAKLLGYYLCEIDNSKVEVICDTRISLADVGTRFSANCPILVASGARYKSQPWNILGLTKAATLNAPKIIAADQAMELDFSLYQHPVIYDPIGGPVAVAVADALQARGINFVFITPDSIAAALTSMTQDLVPANARLARAGVRLITQSKVIALQSESIVAMRNYSGELIEVAADIVIDCSPLTANPCFEVASSIAIGDALAPRGWQAGILQARRAVQELSKFEPSNV